MKSGSRAPTLRQSVRFLFQVIAGLLAAVVSIVGILLWPEAEVAVSTPPGPQRLSIVETRQVIPSTHLPRGLELGAANNNLDAVRHTDGLVYLAFRTAPHHFASPEARIVVLRSRDERQWTFEHSLALGTDLREPRLLSIDDEILLYVSRLGRNAFAFEPQGTSMSVRSSGGTWSELEAFGLEGMIGWRARRVAGFPAMFAYRGGEMTYEFGEPQQRIDLLRSDDGRDWRLWDPEHGAVYVGGGGEADFAQAGSGV